MDTKRKKKERIVLKFNGDKITIVKHDFLPKNTIAMSSDLFNKIKKDGDVNN